jgi:hypothetical protein
MHDVLATTARKLGPAPRKIDPRGRDLHPPLPPWLKAADPLIDDQRARGLLLSEGRLVPSWVVMANTHLFAAGRVDHPALFVYAPRGDVAPDELAEVADEVFAVRGRKPVDPGLAALANELAGDSARVRARPVPAPVARGRGLLLGTAIVFRSALPQPRLASSFLPLLVHDGTSSIAVLPASLWDDELRAVWNDLAAD